MDVKQAVGTAKAYLADLFAGEQIANLGLEEVEFDEGHGIWRITLGFSRPWDQNNFVARVGLGENRSYKIITLLNMDGRIISVKNRQPLAA